MRKTHLQRQAFLLLSLLLIIFAAGYQPPIYGNDPASILRYLYREEGLRLGDHVELLAVEDDGADRFAVFCLEKEPDDVWIVRFLRNENGDYEPHLYPKRMYESRQGLGIYSQPLTGYGAYGSLEDCYMIWSENPDLAEVRYRLNGGPEETVAIPSPPSLTLLVRIPDAAGGWSMRSGYYDASGSELM